MSPVDRGELHRVSGGSREACEAEINAYVTDLLGIGYTDLRAQLVYWFC